ncbi:MAG: hypothetical protein SFT92_03640 [Rickettsiales bacterium]|nr:hypothetical protein [Rickettsiales bacterium]
MALTLSHTLFEPYPQTFRVVRRPFMLNAALVTQSRYSTSDGTIVNGKLINHYENKMADKQLSEKDVFIGIPGFKSLDFLALIGQKHQRYKQAVLCDMNEHQVAIQNDIFKLIAAHETPEGFAQAFADRYESYAQPPAPGTESYKAYEKISPEERREFLTAFGSMYQPGTKDQLEGHMQRLAHGFDCSWLQPNNYQAIREMVLSGSIATVILDLRDSKRMNLLHDSLEEQGLRVNDVYISSAMDFIDPHLKTDYYSKNDSSIKSGHDFCENLLALGDDRTNYIVSKAIGTSPILQSYQIENMSPEQLLAAKEALPQIGENIPWQDKDCSLLFSAGNQVWRLCSFHVMEPVKAQDGELADEHGNRIKEDGTPVLRAVPGSKYYRIFSELPHDNSNIHEECADINATLAAHPAVRVLPNAPDARSEDEIYFQQNSAEEPSAGERRLGIYYGHISSQTFRLNEGANRGSLDAIVSAVQSRLSEYNRGL